MTRDAMLNVIKCTSQSCTVAHSSQCGAQEVVTSAARSVSAALRGTDACMVLPEEASDRERYLGSYPALNPFSAARLAAIDCPLQELLALDACDQVSACGIFAMHVLRLWLEGASCTAYEPSASHVCCNPCRPCAHPCSMRGRHMSGKIHRHGRCSLRGSIWRLNTSNQIFD